MVTQPRIVIAATRYTLAATNSDWVPSGDQNDPSVYQGAVRAPDLCGGGQMFNAANSPAGIENAVLFSVLAAVLSARIAFAPSADSPSKHCKAKRRKVSSNPYPAT